MAARCPGWGVGARLRGRSKGGLALGAPEHLPSRAVLALPLRPRLRLAALALVFERELMRELRPGAQGEALRERQR
jgi:hypothetical protein